MINIKPGLKYQAQQYHVHTLCDIVYLQLSSSYLMGFCFSHRVDVQFPQAVMGSGDAACPSETQP